MNDTDFIYRPDHRIIPAQGTIYDPYLLTDSNQRVLIVKPHGCSAAMYPFKKTQLAVTVVADLQTDKGARTVIDAAGTRLFHHVLFLTKSASRCSVDAELNKHETRILDHVEHVRRRRNNPIRRRQNSVNIDQLFQR